MANDFSRSDLALDITNFIGMFWEEIEKNEGAKVTDFFAEDAIFDSKMVCFTGHQEIKDWFAWRKDQSRTARHMMTNYIFDFSQWNDQKQVKIRAVMTHYGAFGKGVCKIDVPIGIYDVTAVVREGGLHGWTLLHLENDPVFLTDDHVAKSYKVDKAGQ